MRGRIAVAVMLLAAFGVTAFTLYRTSPVPQTPLEELQGTDPVSAATSTAVSAAPGEGVQVKRLTDRTDGSEDCTISYSYWPVFNKDSTRIAVRCDFNGRGIPEFFNLNPATFGVSGREVRDINCAGDMLWSGLDPDLMYCRSGPPGARLSAYNVATGKMTLVRDFTALTPEGGSLNQMSRSIQDDVWAFTLMDAADKPVGYLVWKKSTDEVLLQKMADGNGVDEVQVDKSGRYLTVQTNTGNTQVWDLNTKKMTQLAWGVDGYFHEDTGQGTLLSGCGNRNALCFRTLSDPHAQRLLLAYEHPSQGQAHFSMLADNEAWGLVTGEQGEDGEGKLCRVERPYQCEIYQVRTDGSGEVRRLVPHRSSATTYERSAFGNISRDGRFLAWTSDGGDPSAPTDVYIARITPAP